MSKNHIGLYIGTIFTLVSLLLTITVFIPVLSVLPGVLVEIVSAALISNIPYSNVGKLTVLILSVLLLLVLSFSLLSIWKTAKQGPVSKGKIILILSVCYFLVHSLGFYCYWGLNLDFRSDGQLLFVADYAFPLSSLAFVPIGLLIDGVKNKAANTNITAIG